MALSGLDIHRRNRGEQTLVTLAGNIGPATTPLLRAALEQCLLDGVTVIDIDLTTVGSCDAGGLDVLLSASRRAGRVHACLRLHHPCAQITRLLAADASSPLLAAPAHRPDQPVVKDGIRLRRLTRRQAEGMRADIVDLAAASVAGTSGETYRARGHFLRRLAVSARHPGFAVLAAETTALVGCAFGFPLGPGGFGGRGFERTLQESVQRLTAHPRCVLLTQVVARPHPQNREIARRLQRRLLADLRSPVGVALLHPADEAGQAAFASWGWQNMGEIIGLPGAVAPCVLVLPGEGPVPAHRRPGRR
ncbi:MULTISPECIES: STAS domain-containing protein [unclassified Streptomyces]|uniref:STAS domain-containing protein n=1 Tax=unclassified Streptomyces TaxID=2593676 RepID=UPI0009A0C7B6|nr:STAS domain-containing protein [Streptomyces sp. SAT1]